MLHIPKGLQYFNYPFMLKDHYLLLDMFHYFIFEPHLQYLRSQLDLHITLFLDWNAWKEATVNFIHFSQS